MHPSSSSSPPIPSSSPSQATSNQPPSAPAIDPNEIIHFRQQIAHLTAFAAQTQQMQQQQQQQQQQQSAARSHSSSMSDLPKIRPPSTFTGAMGFAVDDWLSEMEQQFAYYGDKFPNDHVKVSFAVGYLAQNALHWWQHEPDRSNLDWNGFVDATVRCCLSIRSIHPLFFFPFNNAFTQTFPFITLYSFSLIHIYRI